MSKLGLVVTAIVLTACVRQPDGGDTSAELASCSQLGTTADVCVVAPQAIVAGSDIASAPALKANATYEISGPSGGGKGVVTFTPTMTGTYIFYSDTTTALQVCDLTALCSSDTTCPTLPRATEEALVAGTLYQVEFPAGTTLRLHIAALLHDIVFAATLDGQIATDLYTVSLDGTVARRTFTQGDEQFPSWSPDGANIAFIRNARLWVLANGFFGGQTNVAEMVGRDEKPGAASWSPDSTRLVYEYPRPRDYIDLGGGEIVDESYQAVLHIVGADGTGDAELTGTADFTLRTPAWGPDNRIAYIEADDCPDCAGGQDWATINADGTNYQQVQPAHDPDPNSLEPIENLDWSPDGTRWVYTAQSRGGDSESAGEIVTRSPDVDDPVLLTTMGAWYPRWSPDGTMIAFLRADGIYVMGADGSNQRRILAVTNVRGLDW
jgi:Tol biopolymer transport system component